LTDRNFHEPLFPKGDLIFTQPDVMVRYTQLYGLLSTKQTLHVSFAERIAQNQAVFQDESLGRFELYLSFVRN